VEIAESLLHWIYDVLSPRADTGIYTVDACCQLAYPGLYVLMSSMSVWNSKLYVFD